MKERGFSLVELIIALGVSAVVLAMAVGVFQRQERSYAVQNEITERQQNVRVALDMLTRDLRMAGYATGFQANPAVDLDGDGANDSVIINAVDNIGPAADDVADGTDVVTIVYGRLPHELRSGPPATASAEYVQGTNIVLASCDLDGDGFDDLTDAGGVPAMPLGVVYDLSKGAAFRVTARAGNTLTVSPNLGNWPVGAYVCPLNVVRYWIDNENTQGAQDALDPVMPRLMRQNLGRDLGPETVAENITDLQLQYGLDRNHDGQIDADGWVNDFTVATDRPQDAVAVRVWVMGRNPTPRPGYVDQVAAGTTMGNVAVGAAPLYARQILETEVRLRNRR